MYLPSSITASWIMITLRCIFQLPYPPSNHDDHPKMYLPCCEIVGFLGGMAAPGTLDQPGGCRDLSEEEYDIDGDSDWGDFHHFGETIWHKFEQVWKTCWNAFVAVSVEPSVRSQNQECPEQKVQMEQKLNTKQRLQQERRTKRRERQIKGANERLADDKENTTWRRQFSYTLLLSILFAPLSIFLTPLYF